MPLRNHAWLFALAALTSGCVEHTSGFKRGLTVQPLDRPEFWPPPGATLLWLSPSTEDGNLGEAAQRIASTLRGSGYADERWYPIGVGYAHGFAVTTRLERIEEDGAPKPMPERWSPLYREAAPLRWLDDATEMRLPAPGRYRVFFVAFTDLPFEHVSHRATAWNEQTVMAAPGMPPMTLPTARHVRAGFRVGVYVYEYASESLDGEGAFVARDSLPPAVIVERAGLAPLARRSCL